MESSALKQLRTRIEGGLIPAVPVPLDSGGRLHVRAQQAYLRYMERQPVAAVAVWAHTGRGLRLDEDTARTVLRDWREALPDRALIAGVGSAGATIPEQATTETVKMAERALRCGADALLVYAPAWLRGREHADTLILKHHQRLASLGVPLVLFYLYEAAGGIRYSPALLEQLLALPTVLGIKMATLDSVMTYQDVARLVTRHPDKLLITGEERFLGYSLRLGARAALIGMGAVCCAMQEEMIRCHLGGLADRFLTLSDQVDLLGETIFVQPMEGYIKRLLWALVHLGVIPLEAANDPWGPALPAAEFEKVGRALGLLQMTR